MSATFISSVTTSCPASIPEDGGADRAGGYNPVRGARVIANSQFTAGHVRRCHGTGDDRLRIIYRGVDLSEFDLQAVKPERLKALKEKWQIADPARVVLHPARLSRLKGQAVVIEAQIRALLDIANNLLRCCGEPATRREP